MTNMTKILLSTAAMLALTTAPAYGQKAEPKKSQRPVPGQMQAVTPPSSTTSSGQMQAAKPSKTPIGGHLGRVDGILDVLRPPNPLTKGYVLTHEHPMVAMSFGGNYAFTGSDSNYNPLHGIMDEGYSEECGGCTIAGNSCDHGEFHGGLFEFIDVVGSDMSAHRSRHGPTQKSFSHVKYSTEWVREAFNPIEPEFNDARMRIMVAYAMDNETMCDSLYEYNLGNGGPNDDGWSCQRGDSLFSLDRQIRATKAWARANSDWMEVALTAADARRIVESGKLAIIIGIEADYAFGAESKTFDVVERLNLYHQMGVRTFYPAHKLNSRLTGADIYRSVEENPGRLLRINQAFAGCFYVDDNVMPFPLLKNEDDPNSHNYCDNTCGDNHFKGTGLNAACNAQANEVSNAAVMTMLPGKRRFKQLNGFRVYPKPPGFTGQFGSRVEPFPANWSQKSKNSTEIEYNNLGLSTDGRRVMAAAMKKGMIITMDHMSMRARVQLREMSRTRNDYPLNGFHNNPNAILVGGKKVKNTKMQYPNEYDFEQRDFRAIKETGGIFGARLGPINVDEDHPRMPASVRNIEDCPGTATENAKALAFLLNNNVNVAYSLDYSTVTKGTFSATYANCGKPSGTDSFNEYEKDGEIHETEGLSHMGMMKKFHMELDRVGMPNAYLDQLKNDSAEQFLQMWEASEARAGRLINGQPMGLNPLKPGALQRKNP